MVLGSLPQDRFEPSAVGYRAVQIPDGTVNAVLRQELTDHLNRLNRLFHPAPRSMNAGHVAKATISGKKNHAASERCLDRREYVKAVDQ
jgi:hypothetical protein